MGIGAGRTLASLGLRCLRRQLHSDHGRPLPLAFGENLAVLSSAMSAPSSSCVSAEAREGDGQQELWPIVIDRQLLDLAASSVESTQQLSMKDSGGVGSWNVQNRKDRSADDWRSIGVVDGFSLSQGIKRWNSETIASRRRDEALIFRDQDLVSRYLEWRRYDRSASLAESERSPEAAAVRAVGTDGLLSVDRPDCEKSFPALLLSSSSLEFLEESSEITPLEASSVKRKRKKKMNKHKQRKLRRRDRHRN